MGKIKNKSRYPLKTSVNPEDYVIGTDNENNGTTVNFRMGDITSDGTGQQNRIISGEPIWIVGTLDFYIPIITYYLGGKLLTTEPITITLDNGGAQDRIDVIAVTKDSTVYVEQGTESPTPAKPTLPNNTDYLELTFVDIAAGASVPTGASSENIFIEGAGEPTEYAAIENTSGTRIEVAYDTATSISGTKVIRITDPEVGDKVSFVNNTKVTIDPDEKIQLYLYKTAEFSVDAKLEIVLYDSITEVTNRLSINDVSFGFSNGIIGQYQVLSIPLSAFTITGIQFDRIDIEPSNLPTSDVYLDDITRVVGINPPLPMDFVPTGGYGGTGQDIVDLIITSSVTKTSDITNDGADNTSTYVEHDEINLQKEVTNTYTILPADNNKTIWLNKATAFNVTIDNTLDDNFECYFYNIGAGTVTFISGTGTINTPDGTGLVTDKVAILIKVESNNDYRIKGELL